MTDPNPSAFEEKAREIVCVPGFCGCADDLAAGMSDEDASGHTDDCLGLQVAIAKALEEAAEAEREACAKIAEADDSFMMLQDWGLQNAVSQKGQNIAASIRNREEKDNG